MISKRLPIVLSLVTFIAVVVLSVLFFTQKTNFVYVDTSILLEQYQGMIDAKGDFQKKSTTWQANIDTLQSEVTSSIMDYEKELSGMTVKEKELSKKLIQSKQKQFRDYQQAIQQQAQQEDNRMTQEVLSRVNAFLTVYGDKHHYRIIFGTSQGNILYAKDGLDITEEVLKELNNDYLGL